MAMALKDLARHYGPDRRDAPWGIENEIRDQTWKSTKPPAPNNSGLHPSTRFDARNFDHHGETLSLSVLLRGRSHSEEPGAGSSKRLVWLQRDDSNCHDQVMQNLQAMPEEDLAGSASLPGRVSKHEEVQYGSVALSTDLQKNQQTWAWEL